MSLTNPVRSLCRLELVGSHYRLHRIADLIDGNIFFAPMENPITRPGYNAMNIFHPDDDIDRLGLKEGHIGFWDWEPRQEDHTKQQSYLCQEDLRWIEYREFPGIQQLKESLKSGIDGISEDHDYMFGYNLFGLNDGKKTVFCLFVRGTDFQITEDIAVLNNGVVFLEQYEIIMTDIEKTQGKWLSETTRKFFGKKSTSNFPHFKYYQRLKKGECKRRVLVKDIDVIIRDTIKQNLKNSFIPSAGADRSIVKKFLNSIPDSELKTWICGKINCDEPTAEVYINGFLLRCNNYLDCNDIESNVLVRLIGADHEIEKKFMGIVEEKWQKKHQIELDLKRKEIEAEEEKYTEQKQEFEKAEAEYTDKRIAEEKRYMELKQEIAKIEAEYAEKRKLIDDISGQVRLKLEAAQKDAAAFFSEHALYSALMPRQETGVKKIELLPGPDIDLDDNPEPVNDFKDLFEVLCENLKSIGVAGTGKSAGGHALAAYLLAAYFTKTPLIIAGYGAESILDALSAAVVNKSASRVQCFADAAGYGAVTSLSGGEVVIARNAFDMKLLNEIALTAGDGAPFVALAALTREELTIEPRSVFNYALPLNTEYYITSKSTGILLTGLNFKMNHDAKYTDDKRELWLPEHLLPPYAYRRCCQLAARAVKYAGEAGFEIDDVDLLLLQTMPVMLALDARKELLELIKEKDVSNKRPYIFTLMGEPYDEE
jgi:hypothetical protein